MGPWYPPSAKSFFKMGIYRTKSQAPKLRHPGPVYWPGVLQHAVTSLLYRQGCGASCPHRSPTDQCSAPFFRALYALTINDTPRWTGLAPHCLAASDIQGVMNALQRHVITPNVKIFEQRATWGQVLGDRSPLASGAQNVHQAIHDLTYIHAPSAATSLGRWDQPRNMIPFIIRHITRVMKFAPVIRTSIFGYPHRSCPQIGDKTFESHPTHMIQQLFGRTLTVEDVFAHSVVQSIAGSEYIFPVSSIRRFCA